MPIRHILRLITIGFPWLIPLNALAADVRADFLKLIDRPLVPPAVEITPMPAVGSFQEFHFTYDADAKDRVPGILIKPTANASGKLPVVIALHGTGGKKTDELPLMHSSPRADLSRWQLMAPITASDPKRAPDQPNIKDAIFHAWQTKSGHPFYFETVWDVMRLIDYLDTRDDVNKTRIGLFGVSKGGIETYLTAAIDPRVSVAVPCIGLESFKWALEHNDWKTRIGTIQNAFDSAAKSTGIASPDSTFVHQFYDRVAPGIDGEFDGPSMVLLISPRPLMAINGDSDDHTPLPGLKLCTDAAQSAYHAAGAEDHFSELIEPKTAHKVTPKAQAAAIEWFSKWLKPQAPTSRR